MATESMPIFCRRCHERTIGYVVAYDTGHLVQYCKCNRLWDRTDSRPVPHVTYYTDGEVYFWEAGKDIAVNIKKKNKGKKKKKKTNA